MQECTLIERATARSLDLAHVGLLLLLVTSCRQGASAEDTPRPAPPPPSPSAEDHDALRAMIDLYSTDRESLEKFYWIEISPVRRARLAAYYEEWRTRLEAIDFEQLDVAGRVDWHLLRTHLTAESRALEQRAARIAGMADLLPFHERLVALEEARWRSEEGRSREWATLLDGVVEEIGSLRERLAAGREPAPAGEKPAQAEPAGSGNSASTPAGEAAPPISVRPSVAERAAHAIEALRPALEAWFRNQSGYIPDFSWWVEEPYRRLDKALAEYERYLLDECTGEKPEKGERLIGDPIGREALVEELAREMIPYTPEELIAIGERELEWCRGEMERAAEELGLSSDVTAAVDHIKALHVPPGDQAQLVMTQAREVIEFLDARDLVTIPALCRETWRYDMLTEDRQRTLPYAAYDSPSMMVAYPTHAMPHESKLMSMRGNNIHFSRIVTPHELIPGHHLQLFAAQRERPYRKPFRTPFLVEGWALYWEMLLWRLDYARGPEDRVGMLFWRMHRAARIIVSLRFHLGGMTPEEMIDFLVERVGHERDGATSEVRRYIGEEYGPLYQCAYMIGGLQLMALRAEVVDGGRLSDRAFHDAILAENAIPIELIRASLRGEKLARDFQSRWRFAGDPPVPEPK